MNLGVIIGRFQVDDLHAGHVKLVEHVAAKHGHVLVLVGVSPVVGSKRDPLDFATRQKMIQDRFPFLTVAPIPDMPTDEGWSQQLDSMVRLLCPVGSPSLYGGRDSFVPHYKGKLKVVEVELGQSSSGTDVRTVAANRIRVSSDFRAGVIYALSNQYQRVFPTVDIALVGDKKFLLGRKKNQDKWCFPGGFVDQEDVTLEAAAARELREETGVVVQPDELDYVCSHRNADWRYKHADDGVIVTTLFVVFPNHNPKPKAGDDLDEVRFFPFNESVVKDVIPTHVPLVEKLIEEYAASSRISMKKPKRGWENYNAAR